MEVVVIAGGTGFIGSYLTTFWRNAGWEVRILSRKETQVENGIYHWDPVTKTMDERVLQDVRVLVNLSGAGIADKCWTKDRVQELFDSRVRATEFLVERFQSCTTLKQVIQASGGTCYGYEPATACHPETDPFGSDLTARLTKAWEAAAIGFSVYTKLTILRIGIVLGAKGGALPKLAQTIRMGIGSPLGTGKQQSPWIQLEDLARFASFCLEHELTGIYNVAAGNCSNKELTREIARTLKKPLFMPKVPGFVLKWILGKRAELILEGMCVDNRKMLETGFILNQNDLQKAISYTFAE